MTKTLYQRYKYNGKFPFMMFNSNKVAQAMFDGTAAEELVEPSPEIDWSQEYMTFISWQDNNTFKFVTPDGITLKYSTDKQTWTTSSSGVSLTFNTGDKVYVKGSIMRSMATNNNDNPRNYFDCTKLYEVCGNMMSLFYEDNFIGKTSLPSSNIQFLRIFNYTTTLLSARNFIIPLTSLGSYMLRGLFAYNSNILYGVKEIECTGSFGNWALTSFYENCTKIQETPVMRFSATDLYQMIYNSGVKRMIWLGPSGYPANMGTPAAGSNFIRYKLSTNTVSGAYRNFDTLQAQEAFLSIWAETETPYAGMIAGCSDYFVAGDSVTLEYVAVNGTFNGYYDENDNLLSSNSTYTFTAQRSMKIKVKTS